MTHRLLLAAAFLLGLGSPAGAQFYDLDGAYRCLTAPDAACEKELRDQPDPVPAPAPIPVPAPAPAPQAASGPTLEQVIAKVRDKSVGPRELQFLERRAAANQPRAVEVLAWCRLNGVGAPADALAAYWLYRQAAKLGVANAKRNQTAVYATRLSPEERHQVLVQENAQ